MGHVTTLRDALQQSTIPALDGVRADRTGTVSLRGFYKRHSLRIFPAFYCYWFSESTPA
jgi:hypothetical protein